MADDSVFAFAGIWETWKGKLGQVESFAIITTQPNALAADVHDRMPAILSPDAYDLWLDPGFRNVPELRDLLSPYDSAQMKKYPVSTRVNDVNNDDERTAEAIDLQQEPGQQALFE
jgi:putative SOS response-associated peptidase YedK